MAKQDEESLPILHSPPTVYKNENKNFSQIYEQSRNKHLDFRKF